MWKTAFLMSVMLSLGANANTCDIQNIDGIVKLLRQSPQEKHYKETTNRLLELKYEQSIRQTRPEFSAEFNIDNDNSSNKELVAELLFDIDSYRKYSAQKQLGLSDKGLREVEFQKDYNERLNKVILALFKTSQNQFFLEKINNLLSTITSSESIYKNRPIRSRDDEIILSSLNLLKNNLLLKKARLQDQLYEDKLSLEKWDQVNCEIDYKTFSRIIKDLKLEVRQEGELLSLRELKLTSELAQTSADLETRNYLSNLKLGPKISRESNESDAEYKFGIMLSFDLPSLNSNNASILQAKELASLNLKRGEKLASLDKNLFENRFNKYSESLTGLPTFEKLESDIKRIKSSFDSGVVSPIVYLDSYRSYVDFLEASEEVRLNVLESYLNLRGQYVESNL
jgi:hypothetical protein